MEQLTREVVAIPQRKKIVHMPTNVVYFEDQIVEVNYEYIRCKVERIDVLNELKINSQQYRLKFKSFFYYMRFFKREFNRTKSLRTHKK